jgi:hypothetical protein
VRKIRSLPTIARGFVPELLPLGGTTRDPREILVLSCQGQLGLSKSFRLLFAIHVSFLSAAYFGQYGRWRRFPNTVRTEQFR